MIREKEVIGHLQGTLEILDGIRAEPDVLLVIGTASSRIERLIEEIKQGGNWREKVGGRSHGLLPTGSPS